MLSKVGKVAQVSDGHGNGRAKAVETKIQERPTESASQLGFKFRYYGMPGLAEALNPKP